MAETSDTAAVILPRRYDGSKFHHSDETVETSTAAVGRFRPPGGRSGMDTDWETGKNVKTGWRR